MGFSAQNFGEAAGAGGIGAGLFGLMGGNKNPADDAMKYLQQIPGSVSPYYQNYINAGNQAIPQLQGQYGNLMNSPGQVLNNIGSNFHQSPGFQFALQQALQGSNHAAAAGGMAGSPQHEQQNMQIGTQLGNQDYYNWMDHATGLYGQGLQGEQGLYNGGLQSSDAMSKLISQALAAQSQLGYAGQLNQNQAQGSALGNIAGGAATLAAFL